MVEGRKNGIGRKTSTVRGEGAVSRNNDPDPAPKFYRGFEEEWKKPNLFASSEVVHKHLN